MANDKIDIKIIITAIPSTSSKEDPAKVTMGRVIIPGDSIGTYSSTSERVADLFKDVSDRAGIAFATEPTEPEQ